MHHGDGLVSLLGGALLSIVANMAGWMAHSHMFTHGLEMLLYGAVGGLGGWGARKLIDRLTSRKKQQTKG